MTTTTERQSRRRQKLNQIAQDAGFTSWTKYETRIMQKGKIEMDTRVKLIYDGKIVGRITTNQSLTIEEACRLTGIDLNEEDGGDPVWDYEKFKLEY